MNLKILKMKESEFISDFCSRLTAVVSQLRRYGEEVDDVCAAEKILRSFTPKFDCVVCVIEESKDLDSMMVEQFEDSSLTLEEKLKRRKEDPLEQLLKTHASFKGFVDKKSYKGNGQWRGRGGRGGRGRGGSYTIISTMKIKVTSHSEVVVVVNEEAENVEPIKVLMK